MEWPQDGQLVPGIRLGQGKVHHRAGLLQQQAGGAFDLGDITAQGLEVAPVAEVIEGHRQVAVARQRHREGLHQLLRAGKAVRDNHHRQRIPAPVGVRPGEGPRGGAVHGHRRGPELVFADNHARIRPPQNGQGRSDHAQGDQGGKDGD